MNFKTPVLITALTLAASSSFALSDNNTLDDYRDAKTHAKALSVQLESMGIEADATVDFNAPATLNQKLDAYEDKIDELQDKFNAAN